MRRNSFLLLQRENNVMILSALQGNKCFSPRSSLQIRKSGNHMQDCAMPFCGFAHFKLHLPGSVSRPGHPAKPHGALRWLPPLHQGGQGSLRRLPTDKHLPRAHMLCSSCSSWPHPALEQPAWGYPGSAMCHAKRGCQPGTQTQSSWIQVQESRIRGCFHSLTLKVCCCSGQITVFQFHKHQLHRGIQRPISS